TRSENIPYSERIRVEKCVIWTRKSALKIGTETRGDVFRNIIFENNDIVHADRGMAIYLDDGALVENIQFINNRFEHIGGDRNQMLIHMVISDGTGQGRIRDVLIKDNHAHEFSPNNSQIIGLDENHRISDLTIQNLIIKDTIRRNLRDARIEVNHFVEYEFK
ncbi:MAG: glycoside hydrolase, partial [Bacteroidales bacterium]